MLDKKYRYFIAGALQLFVIAGLLFLQGINSFMQVWAPNLLFLILIFDYAGFVIYFIWYYQKKENLCLNHWCLISVAALTGMFIIFFLGMEDTIKQYDATVYWIKSIQVSNGMYMNMLEEFRNIRSSLSAEYGNVPVILHAFFIHYFGNNNIAFCTYNYILYGIPAIALMILYIARLIRRCELLIIQKYFNAVVIISFLCPAMLLPVLSGYVDIIGIVWIGILLNLTLDWELEQISIKKDVVLAVVSVLLLLSRRWYAFYIVGFYFGFGIKQIIDIILAKKLDVQRIFRVVMNLLIIAGISCLFIFILNKDVFTTFLGGNYTEAYEAYKTRSSVKDFIDGFQKLGYFLTLFAAVGFLQLIRLKELKYAVKVLVPPLAACVLFGHVQNMGIHHMYLLIPHLLMLAGIGIYSFLSRIWKKDIVYLVVISLSIVNVTLCFFPFLTTVRGNLGSNIRQYPEKMEIANVIKEAAGYMAQLDGTVYICGEGDDFSSELFNRCLLPDTENALPNMFVTSIVDFRDGFPSQAFMADYLVVREPYKTGFSDMQQVTCQIWDMLINSAYGREYYVLDKKYEIGSDGDCYKIYKKKKPMHYEVIEHVSRNIRDFYGDDPSAYFAYQPDWFVSLADYSKGVDADYLFWDRSLQLSGEGQSMEIAFALDGKFEKMRFSLQGLDENGIINVYADGRRMDDKLIERDQDAFEINIKGMQSVQLKFENPQQNTYMYRIYHQLLE